MRCRAANLFLAVASVLSIGQMISACGQKGDLYLPEPEKETVQQTGASTDAEPVPRTGSAEGAEMGKRAAIDSAVQQSMQR